MLPTTECISSAARILDVSEDAVANMWKEEFNGMNFRDEYDQARQLVRVAYMVDSHEKKNCTTHARWKLLLQFVFKKVCVPMNVTQVLFAVACGLPEQSLPETMVSKIKCMTPEEWTSKKRGLYYVDDTQDNADTHLDQFMNARWVATDEDSYRFWHLSDQDSFGWIDSALEQKKVG